MSKAKFNKSKWQFARDKYGLVGVVIRGCASMIVYGSSEERRIANAHLIAAAPEMYKELQSILNNPHTNLKEEDFDRIEDLLAKARGGL